jgi:hypothetical protein
MSRRFRIKHKRVLAECVRPKFLDVRRIRGSSFVVTDKVLEAKATKEPKK